MNTSVIKSIEINGLFHKYNLKWDLNPDVNILIGINGIGKTTILRSVNALLSKKCSYIKERGMEIDVELTDGTFFNYNSNLLKTSNQEKLHSINYEYITTFDVPLKDKAKIKQNDTPLDKELEQVLYTLGKEEQKSFSNYRFKATNFPELATTINQRIDKLFVLINELFSETGKSIDIDRNINKIIFHKDKSTLSLEQLSSGEKQMLLILFTVFLMDEESCILLMDEPEISLHISWQQCLIDVIRQLNPNCQIIIATHSPSIFGKGWGDKLFFVEDLAKL